jgi:putative ATP-binding cassette transporter
MFSRLPRGEHRQLEDEDSFRSERGNSFSFTADGLPSANKRPNVSSSLGGLLNTIRLWNLVTPFFSTANLAVLFAGSMTVCAQVLITYLPVFIGRATKELTGGTTGKFADLNALAEHLGMGFLCIFMYVSLRGGTQVLIMLIGVRWRYNLTRTIHELYFSRKAYYRVNCYSGLRNLDARLTSDLSTFIKLCCGGVSPPLSSTYVGIIADVFLIITASFACFQRAGSRITAFAYIYNFVTIVFAVCLSIPIAKATEAQEAREADYRHAQMRVQTSAEQVALLQGEEVELQGLDRRLDALTANQRNLVFHYFRLSLANTFSSVGGSLFGLAIASLTLLSRRITFLKFDIEQLTAMLGTIEILSSACQSLPAKLPALNTIGGLSKRVVELVDELQEAQAMAEAAEGARKEREGVLATIQVGGDGESDDNDTAGSGSAGGSPLLSVRSLFYSTPDARKSLAQDLSFVVREGMGVVIRGPSGCGKSSLIRCLAGLWSADSGSAVMPAPYDETGRRTIVFMPQKPYMAMGSLRQQVLYPMLEEDVHDLHAADAQISQLLIDFGLSDILDAWGLEGVATWEDILSIGEQQRLSFARAVFAQPRLLIMDEATSTLDLQNETLCMQRVLDEEIALLTIAHRPSVVRYHQLMITMDMDGNFTSTPLIDMTPC